MNNIVDRIIMTTKQNKISGKDLGNMLDLKKSPLTDWKNGKAKPSIEQVLKICEICAINIEWLLTGKEHGDLTPDEQKLVDTFRGCSGVGQRLIQQNAEAIREQLPAEPDPENEQPAGVSTSAIG